LRFTLRIFVQDEGIAEPVLNDFDMVIIIKLFLPVSDKSPAWMLQIRVQFAASNYRS